MQYCQVATWIYERMNCCKLLYQSNYIQTAYTYNWRIARPQLKLIITLHNKIVNFYSDYLE